MKKFKSQKEILTNPEFANLAYELLIEESGETNTSVSQKKIEDRISLFVNRKLEYCKMRGV